MFPVATGARLPVGDGDHRLHGHDHAGFQHRLDVLAEFHAGLPAVVVAEYPEAVSVAEGPVLQQAV